ncbi:MAG TPA: hypothetical protein VKB19_08190 [Pedobacter sp.]|nr:hypothetical protein [Pedobacter sp.]
MKLNTSIKFKYKIWDLMEKLTKPEYDEAILLFPDLIGKCKNTVRNYLNIKITSATEIPHTVMLIFEDFFGVPPRGLCNMPTGGKSYKDLLKNSGKTK